MTDLRLPPEQAAYLRDHLATHAQAKHALDLVFTAIVRGHGLTTARFVALTDDTLTIEGTDAGPA